MKKLLLIAMTATAIATIMAVSGCGDKKKTEDSNTGTGFTEVPILYTEPITVWGLSKSALRDKVDADPTLLFVEDDAYDDGHSEVAYQTKEEVDRGVVYYFDSRQALYKSVKVVASTTADKIKEFLSSRYKNASTYIETYEGCLGVYMNYNSTVVITFIADQRNSGVFYVFYDNPDLVLSYSAPSRGGGAAFSLKALPNDNALRALRPR